jgi:hypothetical protein
MSKTNRSNHQSFAIITIYPGSVLLLIRRGECSHGPSFAWRVFSSRDVLLLIRRGECSHGPSFAWRVFSSRDVLLLIRRGECSHGPSFAWRIFSRDVLLLIRRGEFSFGIFSSFGQKWVSFLFFSQITSIGRNTDSVGYALSTASGCYCCEYLYQRAVLYAPIQNQWHQQCHGNEANGAYIELVPYQRDPCKHGNRTGGVYPTLSSWRAADSS